MPANIEIKAHLKDPGSVRALAGALASRPPERLEQQDTFFRTRSGRLKLREFGDGSAELIYYERSDITGPARSVYLRAGVADGPGVAELLRACAGVRGVVRKVRNVYLIGRTRVHIDDVEGLGSFVELEVVLSQECDEDQARGTAVELMRELGIAEEDLVCAAYVDLLEGLDERRPPVAGLGSRSGIGNGEVP
ncbi:MAG: class IV adenylate cyclase [Candidatus Eisenbacteria bacterium]